MPKVQQSTSSRLKIFVLEFKETFTSDEHVLFYVLYGHFFFFFNAYKCLL
jgi:hypothetical protein